MTVIESCALLLIGMAALIGLYRLLFGPSTGDRIVATDSLNLIATVVLVLLSLFFGSVLYLDVALIYAVLSFVGMIALARVIESNVDKNSNQQEDG